MNFKLQISGWKIVLNTTEFIIVNPGFEELQWFLKSENRKGVTASGLTMIDKEPNSLPSHDLPLLLQKPWAVDDNCFGRLVWLRQALGHPKSPQRNRFFHSLPTRMYVPGRHRSYHHDWQVRPPNLMVIHYAYSP
jgi:hypothetical protein